MDNASPPRASRLAGLDLARYLALAGMVFVNFRLAIAPAGKGPTPLAWLFGLLEGKASAVFVVLAGLGFTLATRSMPAAVAHSWTLRRALFLLCVGMLNLLAFPADIIHYYAAYFALALPWRTARIPALAGGIAAVAAVSAWALVRFDYNRGWDWATLHYADLWSAGGFLRNLLFNGFHPLLPWLALFLFGMLLARLPLHSPGTVRRLAGCGIAVLALAAAIERLAAGGPWAELLGTAPLPPGPAYLLAGIGTASFVIAACLLAAARWRGGPWRHLLPAGRMTLTLYLAHIFLGMGLLEALGALDGSGTLAEAALAATVFVLVATVAAWAWSRTHAHGPAEGLMRRVTARG